MNTFKNKTALTNTLAATIIALCSAAQAGDFDGEATTTPARQAAEKAVNYADLNLKSDRGREILANRISRAARDVCGPTDYRMTGSLQIALRNRTCVAEAVHDAMSRVSGGASVAAR